MKLNVQTVPIWKRALVVSFGLAAVALALFCFLNAAPWWIWLLFGLIGIGIVLVGFLGKKAYLEQELQKLQKNGPAIIGDALVNAILDAII